MLAHLTSLLLLSGLGYAAPPDKQALVLSVGSGTIHRLQLDATAGLLSGRDLASKTGFVLDVDAWVPQVITSCAVGGIASARLASGYEVYVGCEDGTIQVHTWQEQTLTLERALDSNGDPLTFTVVEDGELLGLWYDPVDDALLTLVLPTTMNAAPMLHHVDALSGAVDGPGGFPLQTQFPGFKEAVIVQDTLGSDSLLVLHQQSTVTRYNLDSGQLFGTPTFGGFISVDDITPTLEGSVYGVDRGNGIVARFDAGTGQFLPLLTDLTLPEAVVASLTPNDEWLLVSQSVGLYVWELEAGLVVNESSPVVSQPTQTLNLQDAVLTGSYVLGGGIGGNCKVLTSAPFATELAAEPTTAGVNDTIAVAFTVDGPADWRLLLNGDRNGGGLEVASGRIDTAGGEERVVVPVDDRWEEGRNRLYVLLTEAGQTTHRRVDVVVDTPPPAPQLTASNVGFRSRALILRFPGVEVADLSGYDVYVSTTPFQSADFAEGGPPWDGASGLVTPIRVSAEPGAEVEVDIRPLQNDIKHYIAVRTVDQGGLVSPLSNVVSGTPQRSFSASELAGETGGGPCSVGGRQPLAWAAIALGAALLRRRRAWVAVAALLVSVQAAAAPDDRSPEQRKADRAEARLNRADQTPVYGNFEARYGFVSLVDETLNDVYDASPHNVIQLEFGPQLYRVLELDFQVGWLREPSVKKALTSEESVDRTVLSWFPLGVAGTARLHLVDEQVLVPYARYGVDLTVWNEKFDVGGERTSSVRGSKVGTHYAFGLSLLLDTFDRPRASLLEAQTGVNDTYLTVEWRRQAIDARNSPWGAADTSGLVFSADVISVGLKLDY